MVVICFIIIYFRLAIKILGNTKRVNCMTYNPQIWHETIYSWRTFSHLQLQFIEHARSVNFEWDNIEARYSHWLAINHMHHVLFISHLLAPFFVMDIYFPYYRRSKLWSPGQPANTDHLWTTVTVNNRTKCPAEDLNTLLLLTTNVPRRDL